MQCRSYPFTCFSGEYDFSLKMCSIAHREHKRTKQNTPTTRNTKRHNQPGEKTKQANKNGSTSKNGNTEHNSTTKTEQASTTPTKPTTAQQPQNPKQNKQNQTIMNIIDIGREEIKKLYKNEKYDEAINQTTMIIKMIKNIKSEQNLTLELSQLYQDLAIFYAQKNNTEEAKKMIDMAWKLNPTEQNKEIKKLIYKED